MIKEKLQVTKGHRNLRLPEMKERSNLRETHISQLKCQMNTAIARKEDKRSSHIEPKENMDEVTESLWIMVSGTIVNQTGNGHTSITSQLSG